MAADNLLKLYRDIAGSLGVSISDNDVLLNPDTEQPLLAGENALVLPSYNVRRNGPEYWESHMAFHPLSENVHRGESAVQRRLLNLITFRLSSVIDNLLGQLVVLGNDREREKHLNPEQHELLDVLKAIDSKTIKFVNKVRETAAGPDKKYRFIKIFVKSGGRYKEQKHQRVCVINFPLLDQVNTESSTIFGVKGRQADVAVLPKLFTYILPESDQFETYNYGSNDRTAPYFHALMYGFMKVASQLNKVIDRFGDHLEEHASLRTDLKWITQMENLGELRNEIPSFDIGYTDTSVKNDDNYKKEGITMSDEGKEAVKLKPVKGKYSWNDLKKAAMGTSDKSEQPVEQAQQQAPTGQASWMQRRNPPAGAQGGFWHSNQPQQASSQVPWAEEQPEQAQGQAPVSQPAPWEAGMGSNTGWGGGYMAHQEHYHRTPVDQYHHHPHQSQGYGYHGQPAYVDQYGQPYYPNQPQGHGYQAHAPNDQYGQPYYPQGYGYHGQPPYVDQYGQPYYPNQPQGHGYQAHAPNDQYGQPYYPQDHGYHGQPPRGYNPHHRPQRVVVDSNGNAVPETGNPEGTTY